MDGVEALPARKPGAKHAGEAAWKDAMTALMKSDPGIHSMLSAGGKFIGCEGNVYRWQGNEADSFFLNALSKEETRKRVSEVLGEATGGEAVFEPVSPGQRAETFDDEGFIRELRDTFPPGTMMVQE